MTTQTITPKHAVRIRDIEAQALGTDDMIKVPFAGHDLLVRVQQVRPTGKPHHVMIMWRSVVDDPRDAVRGSTHVPSWTRFWTHEFAYVGMPATIHLFTDSLAAVVTKINAKTIVVQRVDTSAFEHDERYDGEYPVMRAEGITTQIVGKPERYPVVNGRVGTVATRVSLGRSISIRDYRH